MDIFKCNLIFLQSILFCYITKIYVNYTEKSQNYVNMKIGKPVKTNTKVIKKKKFFEKSAIEWSL